MRLLILILVVISQVCRAQASGCDEYIKRIGDDNANRYYISANTLTLSAATRSTTNKFDLSFNFKAKDTRKKLQILIRSMDTRQVSGSFKIIFKFAGGRKCPYETTETFKDGLYVWSFSGNGHINDKCLSDLQKMNLSEIILERVPGDLSYHLKISPADAKLIRQTINCLSSML